MLLTKRQSKENAETADRDPVAELRNILSAQQQRGVGYEEASEIGMSLVEFYETLAEEIEDEPAS